MSIAFTFGAEILFTESSATLAAPSSPNVTIKFPEIEFPYSIKSSSTKASRLLIVANSTSLGINQSVKDNKFSEGIFAGAGFNIVVILFSLAKEKTFSVTSSGISNCPTIIFKSVILESDSITFSASIRSLEPEITIILFCPDSSTHIGATPL